MQTVSIVVAAVIVLLVIVVATRPGSFRVERWGLVSAPPAEVFGYVNDFHRWTAWSPWESIDPDMARSYSGPAAGAGASYRWSGNSRAGQGEMTIRDSVPAERILIDLRFDKPFKAENTTEFTFSPSGSGTRVTWAMYGRNSVMGKVMSLFGGMDRMVGKDFDRGLGNLAAVVQSDGEGLKARARGQGSVTRG